MMSEYEAIERFRDELDSTYPDVTLPDGIDRSPSFVLEQVDPISFREMFLGWCDALGIDTDDLN